MGKPKEKSKKERTCRGCKRRIQNGNPHGTCWEHLGEFHVCGKCVDLKSFQECWGSDKNADNTEQAADMVVSTEDV